MSRQETALRRISELIGAEVADVTRPLVGGREPWVLHLADGQVVSLGETRHATNARHLRANLAAAGLSPPELEHRHARAVVRWAYKAMK